jgi:hypothetical protein
VWGYTSTPPTRLHGVVLSLKKRVTAEVLFFIYFGDYKKIWESRFTAPARKEKLQGG